MFATQDQDTRRAGARGLTRNNHGSLTRSLRRAAAGAMCAAAVALPLISAAGAQAATTATFTPLTLMNGWTNYGAGTANAAVTKISGIVHLKGAIKTAGTNGLAFTLPKADRPATNVYVPVDMCNATHGLLGIEPSGVVSVESSPGNGGNAQCFTSLDGVSFATSATSFTPLTLMNGWTNASPITAGPAVRVISGVVHLEGAIKTSDTNQVAFTLPAGFRPANTVYVPVSLCGASNGRLIITKSGVVSVQLDGPWSDAHCFISLEGASFAKSATSYTPLTLQNGWAKYGFGTAGPAVRNISGIVHLRGAIKTSGSNQVAFTLPAGFRPANTVYVKADLCDATNGRLIIAPSGVVSVQSEGPWSDAQCFTSLDGVSFAQ